MTEPSVKVGNVRITFSHSSTLLKMLVVALLVFSLVAVAALTWVRIRVESQTQAIEAEAIAVSGENQKLNDRLADMESDEAIEEIAKEELGLVDPDATIMDTK